MLQLEVWLRSTEPVTSGKKVCRNIAPYLVDRASSSQSQILHWGYDTGVGWIGIMVVLLNVVDKKNL